MNISFISHATLNHCCENILSSLTASQKKIAAIALAILSCAALGYAFFRFCHFKATVLDSAEVKEIEEENEIVVPENCFTSHLEDGRTKKVFSDGRIEIGHFKEGVLNGQGMRTFPDPLMLEKGQVDAIKAYPFGHLDIRCQNGTFKDGELNGKGEILFFDHFKDGQIQKGRFQAGIFKREVQLFIKGLEGKTHTLAITLDDTVAHLKSLMEKELDIRTSGQARLIWAGKQLDEEGKTLEAYGLQKESIIHVAIALKGD